MDLQTAKRATITIQKKLGLNPDETFVEPYFIDAFIRSNLLKIGDIEEGTFNPSGELDIPCITITLKSNDPDNPGYSLRFIYYGGDNSPTGLHHGLMITDADDGSVVYWREPGQDPKTEWLQNMLAGDPEVIDENGHIAFTGDPVQE